MDESEEMPDMPPSGPLYTDPKLTQWSNINTWGERDGKPVPPFRKAGLALQGGGALGSYQVGVYKAMAEAGLEPQWIAGTSIGAINGAIIAGNPPEKRVAMLEKFWKKITTDTYAATAIDGNGVTAIGSAVSSWLSTFKGIENFCKPLLPHQILNHTGKTAPGFYDVSLLKNTLASVIDMDYLNDPKNPVRLCIGVVDMQSGQLLYFGNKKPESLKNNTADYKLTLDHIIASGSLPPAFPCVKINGRYYGDGGTALNNPLQHAVDEKMIDPDTLVVQGDLWNPEGPVARTNEEAEERKKDFQYCSRTRRVNVNLVDNIMQLICPRLKNDTYTKDHEFSRGTMQTRFEAGYNAALDRLCTPKALARLSKEVIERLKPRIIERLGDNQFDHLYREAQRREQEQGQGR